MNSIAPRPPRRSRWRIIAEVSVAAALVWSIAVAMVASEVLALDGDAAELRREVLSALDLPVERQVQVAVGPATLSATRTLLHFIPEAPAEAREALNGVVRGSVAVYGLRSHVRAADSRAVFEAAEHALQPRGWTRVVGVHQDDKVVVIYTPTDPSDDERPEICLAVLDGRQLVIVQGQVDAKALVRLASHRRPALAWR